MRAQHASNSFLPARRSSACFLAVLCLAGAASAQGPELQSIEPVWGLEQGGALVTLSGTGLDTVLVATVGGQPLSNLTVVSATTLTGNVAAGAAGIVDVVVSGPSGADALEAAFAYTSSVHVAGTALRFDGTNDLATFGSFVALGPSTIEAWVRPEEGNAPAALIIGPNAGPGEACMKGTALRAHGDDTLCYMVDIAGCGFGWNACQSGTQLGQWYHLAGTYDGDVMRFYVDGVLADEQSGAVLSPSTWLTAGASIFFNGGQQFFSGVLDEARIWDRVRSVQEINDGMHRRLSGGEAGLVGYWRFDEGAGQAVAPVAGAGPTGVLGLTASTEPYDPTWVPSQAPIFAEGPVPPATYCTAKVNSQGCLPAMQSSGAPSLSSPTPFLVEATQVVNNVGGILFYGKGSQAAPFHGGTLCVQPPTMRTALQLSGGSPVGKDCTGSFSLDFNAYLQAGADPSLVAGVLVHGQYWFRDPDSPSTTGLSDGLAFLIAP